MSNERIPWDQYFMAQAVLLSLRSTCTRLEVGATLVEKNGSLLEATMALLAGMFIALMKAVISSMVIACERSMRK